MKDLLGRPGWNCQRKPICMSFGLRLEGQGRAIVGIHNVPKGEGVKHFISSVVHLEGNESF